MLAVAHRVADHPTDRRQLRPPLPIRKIAGNVAHEVRARLLSAMSFFPSLVVAHRLVSEALSRCVRKNQEMLSCNVGWFSFTANT